MTRQTCDLLVLLYGVAHLCGWLAWDTAHPTCSDPRFTGHLRWNLDVECRR